MVKKTTLSIFLLALSLASIPAHAGIISFIRDIISGSNSGSSGSSSGNSGSGNSGSGVWQEPEYTEIYIPPAQPYVFVEVPRKALVTRGTVVHSLDQELVEIPEYDVCKEVDNRRPANDDGTAEEQENGIFIPYKSKEEWDSFAANKPPDVTLKDCSPTVVAVAVPGQWVRVLNFTEGPIAACARVGATAIGGTGINGLGTCASDESAPGDGSGSDWNLIVYPNNLHHLKKNIIYQQKQGGSIITQSGGTYYCYKPGQKKDNDKTDLAAAFLCTIPTPAVAPASASASAASP